MKKLIPILILCLFSCGDDGDSNSLIGPQGEGSYTLSYLQAPDYEGFYGACGASSTINFEDETWDGTLNGNFVLSGKSVESMNYPTDSTAIANVDSSGFSFTYEFLWCSN